MVSLETMTADRDYWRKECAKLQAVVDGMKSDAQEAYQITIEEEREKQKLLLQIDEAKALLKRFLDAGPEEEYQVILCKLSRDVEAFLSGKQEKRKCPSHEYVFSGALGKRICELCGASE